MMSLIGELLNLFQVDSQVRGLRSRLDSAQRFLNGQQRKLDELLEQRAELETRRKHHKAKIANVESQISSMNERIDKLREELNQAETNKQYSALLTEINTLKAQRDDLESSMLEDMTQVETLDAEIESLKDEEKERSTRRDQARKELEERTADVSERLAELESERAVAAESVPENELRIFDELADTYDGEAMAQIEVIDKRNREYACGACNMHVPFEAVSRLVTGNDDLVRCNVCRRILYMKEETRGALAGKK